MYTGKMQLTTDQFKYIITAANMLGIESLQKLQSFQFQIVGQGDLRNI